jgi:hypothetical protein
MSAMEPLPDFASLSDDELKQLIEQLERAERTARLRKSVGAGDSHLADVDTLSDILSQKGSPSTKDPAA